MTKRASALLIIFGALPMLIPAFVNGYPIVYSDTGTYLSAGFELTTPFDRPMIYGLFLWLTSFGGLTLWTVIYFQSLIVSYLLFRLASSLLESSKWKVSAFVSAILLTSLFTSLSWTSSQLIADLFTPILLLSIAQILIGKNSKWQKVFLYFIFFLATTTHLSHISFNVSLLVLLIIIGRFSLKEHLRWQPLVSCLVLSLLGILTMGSALAKSKHIFFMGAMVEHGILKEYLDKECGDKDYRLCAYKDSLPDKAWQFVWEDYSPLHKVGGWKGTREEFNEIIFNTLTTPEYLWLHARESVKATGDQFVRFGINDGNGSFLEGTRIHTRIGKYYPHELKSYENAVQNNSGFHLNWWNRVIYGFTAFCGLVLIAIVFRMKLDSKTRVLLIVILLGVLINAWASGTFANAIDRLGAKTMWLIPLVTILLFVKKLRDTKKVTE